ncbi:MAG: DNA modification methylase [Prevotellaceae bacterium]|jgi:DNA modification methylase|nr:DNA modification methylase [Prevotellaceae bacterium]
MENLKWHTEQRVVKTLIPLDFNPRKRNEQKQLELLKSIEDFNLVDTPVLNLDGVLISGQRRLEALFELGRADEIIDVRLPNRMLSADEVKRYCLLANTHSGEWDLVKLETNFTDIYKEILDLPDISAELKNADLLDKSKEKSGEIVDDGFDDVPDDTPAVAKLGDMFELNQHKIICGDCTDYAVIKQLMNGSLAQIVFTDPPYNVRVQDIVKTKHSEFQMASGEMNKNRFTRFLEDVFLNLIKATSDGSIHYICMDWKHVNELSTAGKIYTEFKNLIVWKKDNGGMGAFYRSQHELIFIFKNGKGKHINNFQMGQTGRYRTNVWEYSGMSSVANKERDLLDEHPTVKPVKLVADALLDCSNYGNTVLDVFLGSGTTLIAAEQTGRTCFGSELEPKYIDTIIRRYLRFMKNYNKPVVIKRNGTELSDEKLKKWQ